MKWVQWEWKERERERQPLVREKRESVCVIVGNKWEREILDSIGFFMTEILWSLVWQI
jgi:hypothetical protein